MPKSLLTSCSTHRVWQLQLWVQKKTMHTWVILHTRTRPCGVFPRQVSLGGGLNPVPMRMPVEQHRHTKKWWWEMNGGNWNQHTERRSANWPTCVHSLSDNCKKSIFIRLVRSCSCRPISYTKVSTCYSQKSIMIMYMRNMYVSVPFSTIDHHICWGPLNLHVNQQLCWLRDSCLHLNGPVQLLLLRRGMFLVR
jgi:hypothetical protein